MLKPFILNSSLNLSPSEFICFWLGFLQTDGTIYAFLRFDRKGTMDKLGLPKPEIGWQMGINQNLIANILGDMKRAFMNYGFVSSSTVRSETSLRNANEQLEISSKKTLINVFSFWLGYQDPPFFIGQKERNLFLIFYLIKNLDTLTGAQLIGIHFTFHKLTRFDADLRKPKWTKDAVCKKFGYTVEQMDKAANPILTKIDQVFESQQEAYINKVMRGELQLQPAFVVSFFEGDGSAHLNAPALHFTELDQPCVKLSCRVKFFAEKNAVNILWLIIKYLNLKPKKLSDECGGEMFGLTISSFEEVDAFLKLMLDQNHRNFHCHIGRTTQLNLIFNAQALREEYNNQITDYYRLEALMAYSFAMSYASLTYKNRTYSYKSATANMRDHLGILESEAKPYSYYYKGEPDDANSYKVKNLKLFPKFVRGKVSQSQFKRQKVSILGIEYPTVAAASRAYNCDPKKIRRWIETDPDNCFRIE